MIGNTGCQSVGIDRHFWYTTGGDEYEVTSWLGGYVRHGQKEQVTTAIIAACRKARSPYPICGSVPNVTGPRQTTCHDFPDIEPDDPETPVLEDVETPSDESPLDTVEQSGSPRQDGVQYLVWSCLTKTPIAEMIAELQPHDRDDIRQDLALKYWRKAVRQELRGHRISNLTKWLTADVRQWIGERTDTAIAGPETKAETEERKAILSCPIGGTKTPTADDSAAVQREKSTESRLAMLDHELRIEQSRFAAEIEAKHRAAKPKAILALKW